MRGKIQEVGHICLILEKVLRDLTVYPGQEQTPRLDEPGLEVSGFHTS